MSIKFFLTGSLILAASSTVSLFATPEAMIAAAAIQTNARLASSVSLTKDADANIISFHVNGVLPSDAEILLKKDPSPLSTEFTVICGTDKKGTACSYMLPSHIATAYVIETISRDLVNSGATTLQISKQLTGK